MFEVIFYDRTDSESPALKSILEDQIKRILIQAGIDAGLTQKEPALKSRVRQPNISHIESGAVILTLQTLNALAKGIGKTIENYI